MSGIKLISTLLCLLFCQRCQCATSTTAATRTASTSPSATPTGSTTVGSNITATGTITTTATTVTTTTTTTTEPPPTLKHNTATAIYVLKLTVGPNNNSDILYVNSNATAEDLLAKLRGQFTNISVSVNLVSNNNDSQTNGSYILEVGFLIKDTNATSDIQTKITAALTLIDRSTDFNINNNITAIVSQFISSLSDVCSAQNVCPLGFNCNSLGCTHMCATRDCSGHGTCFTTIDKSTAVTTICQCDSEYATEYMGDNCEQSRHGRLEIIAIIAGVLGAACLVLIIIIIVLCCKGKRNKSSTYNLSGQYGNDAYENSQHK